MSKVTLLDSGPLSKYTHAKATHKNELCRQRVNALLVAGDEVWAPGISVYEVRRELVRSDLIDPAPGRVARFDAAVAVLGILPVTQEVLQRATEVWADARLRNLPMKSKDALEGDVILVAQAFLE